MIELELSDDVKNCEAKRGVTAWRLECSLREFKNFVPVEFWFEYPIHRMDNGEHLKSMPAQGSHDAGKLKSKFHKPADIAEEEFRTAYKEVNFDGTGASVADMASFLGLAERTIRDRIKKMNEEFTLEKGRVRCATERADLNPEI